LATPQTNKYGVLFVVSAATICQACFGWLGFNPTDEGFVLEGSYRILHGQWPHHDFASIRPALSSYLHLPEVWLGGSYTLWISRYVAWLQMAAIAWWWVALLTGDRKIVLWQRVLLAGIALCLSAHTFPLTAIHTIDGLFLLTLAFYRAKKDQFLIAGQLAGMALLCKQSFLFGLPLLVVFYPKHALRLLVPALLLVVGYLMIFYLKAGSDLWAQLSGQSGFIDHAVLPYLLSSGLWIGVVAGIIGVHFFKIRVAFPAGVLLLALVGLCYGKYIGQFNFGLLGLAIGTWLSGDRNNKIALFMLATAWMTGISVGYNSPALFSGVLMIYLILKYGSIIRHPRMLVALWAITWVAFSYARLWQPYREMPFYACIYPVGAVMAAGKGLYTNEQTYLVLQELDSLKRRYPGSVPVPDFVATWPGSGTVSSLPTLWPNKTETTSHAVQDNIEKVIIEGKGKHTWLVQRFVTAELANGLIPMANVLPYPIVELITKHCKASDTTTYFIVYQ
jgi:hypothetical protein